MCTRYVSIARARRGMRAYFDARHRCHHILEKRANRAQTIGAKTKNRVKQQNGSCRRIASNAAPSRKPGSALNLCSGASIDRAKDTAVSYTHLDVYKRQVAGDAQSMKQRSPRAPLLADKRACAHRLRLGQPQDGPRRYRQPKAFSIASARSVRSFVPLGPSRNE